MSIRSSDRVVVAGSRSRVVTPRGWRRRTLIIVKECYCLCQSLSLRSSVNVFSTCSQQEPFPRCRSLSRRRGCIQKDLCRLADNSPEPPADENCIADLSFVPPLFDRDAVVDTILTSLTPC